MKLLEESSRIERKASIIRLLSATTLFIITALVIPVFAIDLPGDSNLQMQDRSSSDPLVIEIYSGERRVLSGSLAADSAGRSVYQYFLLRPAELRVDEASIKTADGNKIYAFQIFPEVVGNAVQVRIVALLEDLALVSNGRPIYEMKRQAVGTHQISENGEIVLSEMTKLGIPPLKVKVFRGKEKSQVLENRMTIRHTENVSRQPLTDGQKSGVTALKILSKPRPQYTSLARQNGTVGNIRLRVAFLASGEIGEVTAENTLNDGLTEMAIEAAKAIRFDPATENGVPVTVTKVIEYSFSTY